MLQEEILHLQCGSAEIGEQCWGYGRVTCGAAGSLSAAMVRSFKTGIHLSARTYKTRKKKCFIHGPQTEEKRMSKVVLSEDNCYIITLLINFVS